MNRSPLPFFAASIADRSASAALRLRRDKSSISFVIYRKAVYQTEAAAERLVPPSPFGLRRDWGPAVRLRTIGLRVRTSSSRALGFQAGNRGYAPCSIGAHAGRSSICVARVVE